MLTSKRADFEQHARAHERADALYSASWSDTMVRVTSTVNARVAHGTRSDSIMSIVGIVAVRDEGSLRLSVG